MGLLLSLPISFFSTLIDHGFLYALHYGFTYAYLKLCQMIWKDRFDLYDFLALKQPTKSGFFVPQKEWDMDTPNMNASLRNFADDAFCFGTNSSSEYLAVHISRRPNDHVQCSLLLRLKDGKTYYLPTEHLIQRATSEENAFGSSRLKLQCLIPMRKWRLFFNGLLEESSSSGNKNSNEKKHVKFTLIWTASSDVFDFSCNMSKQLLSQAEATQKQWLSIPMTLTNKLKSIFDGYDQPGMLLGTIKVEDEEEREIYLWGARGRFMGNMSGLRHGNNAEVYGNFENGSMIRIGTINIPGTVKKYPYGYVMRSDGFIYCIDEFDESVEIITTENKLNISCAAGGQKYKISAEYSRTESLKFRREFNGASSIKTVDLEMNGKKGNGFIFRGLVEERSCLNFTPNSHRIFNYKTSERSGDFTISLESERCQDSKLSGGKGSSLAKLFAISGLSNLKSEEVSKFAVTNGIVVSTEAYREFIKGSLSDVLDKFEKDIWSRTNSAAAKTKAICQNVVDIVGKTKLPEIISISIEKDLRKIFGDSLVDRKFSVRSSATGEDTEQMSAAGQMSTYLGVKGMPEILKAVANCWASQFSFEAVEYKRRYGQLLNAPMAVVIQEMAPCEAAGVMFTCDPVTGNPSFICITANWGLGESVVSGSVEPDTITLKRDIQDKLQFHSQLLGNKKSKIVMDQAFGTKEVEMDEHTSNVCCISTDMALRLGKIATKIESCYGAPQDIEWGIVDGDVFLFQSRPVTSIDMETDFETIHFHDTHQRIENEYFSRANVGEVMPGAVSPLGLDQTLKCNDVVFPRQYIRWDGEEVVDKPYFQKKSVYAYNHFLCCLTEGYFRFSDDTDDYSKSLVISLFGRLIDDKEICRISKERHCHPGKKNYQSFLTKFLIFLMRFVAGVSTRYQARKLTKKNIPYKKVKTANQIFQNIAKDFDIFPEAYGYHLNCSFSSSNWNMSVLCLLAKANGEWNNKVYGDFAYLLSSCTDVLSAEVPTDIEDLAVAINKTGYAEVFKQMEPDEAINWLKTNTSEVGKKYKDFMEKHGHRCKKEFDAISEPWEVNPRPLIISLQGLNINNDKIKNKKKPESFLTIISKLQIKLSWYEKLQLLWLLPNTRRGVREREFSKSFMIRMVHKLRKPFYRMAELMVEEGRLPQKELMFFLCFEEIVQLFKTRSPRLVSKAFRRWKCQNELHKLVFEQIIVGIPKPINENRDFGPVGKGFIMTGIPVSQGVVKATARVIMNFEEAHNIQNGDVLITHGTDTAWSPYFTLLSGVVTELGGLISHGAVVAREYGLPCVVALTGATRAFKSGDLVILDGTKGTLQRVEED